MGIAWITRFFAGRSTELRVSVLLPPVCGYGESTLRINRMRKFSKKQKSSPEIAIFTPCGCLIAPNYPYLPLNYLTNSFLQVFF